MLTLFRCTGIYVGKYSNVLKQAPKVKAAVKHTFEERLIENQKKHMAMNPADKNYCEDIVWEKEGTLHSTCSSDIRIDGAGCTHFYNHRHQEKQSAFIFNSIMTGKPLA
jgi:hypothetical protein